MPHLSKCNKCNHIKWCVDRATLVNIMKKHSKKHNGAKFSVIRISWDHYAALRDNRHDADFWNHINEPTIDAKILLANLMKSLVSGLS